MILSAQDSVDDELSLDDPALARELEELRAQRRPDANAASPLPSQVKPAKGDPEASNTGAHNAGRNDLSSNTKGRAGSSQGAKRSLADQILGSSSGNDELELEFEAMEQQLQKQLLEYKKQCQSPAGAAPGAAAAGPGSGQPTRDVKVDPRVAEESDPAKAHESQPREGEPPELINLRTQAAQLEEVFPESGDATSKIEEKRPMRRIRAGAAEREKNRSEAPADPEMLSLRNALENLDLKLRAVQKHSALQDPLQRQPVEGASAGARVIAELQAQNAHLRERFQVNGKEKLLHLDKSLFGADVAVQPTS